MARQGKSPDGKKKPLAPDILAKDQLKALEEMTLSDEAEFTSFIAEGITLNAQNATDIILEAGRLNNVIFQDCSL